MSAVAELKRDLLELHREYDGLTRMVEAKHEELDLIQADVRRANAELEKIRSEIKRIKQHFGVQP
jgi:hypothetical protein